MSRFAITIVICLAAILLFGCTTDSSQVVVSGSGVVTSLEMSLKDFDKVEVSHAFQVIIRHGDSYDVVLHVDEELVDYLEVTQRSRTLSIGLQPEVSYQTGKATMRAEVIMPALRGLGLSGASHATITGFESTKELGLGLSGASSLEGEIAAESVQIGVSGASRVDLRGTVKDLIINASGSSDLDLSHLIADDAFVRSSGACDVAVNVSGELRVSASGSSRISYLGEPKLKQVNTSGSVSLIQEG